MRRDPSDLLRHRAHRGSVYPEGVAFDRDGSPMFGVNGITFDGEGAILAVNTTAGTLQSIALADAHITPVALARPLAPDGLRLDRIGRAIDVLADGLRDIDGAAWVSEGSSAICSKWPHLRCHFR